MIMHVDIYDFFIYTIAFKLEIFVFWKKIWVFKKKLGISDNKLGFLKKLWAFSKKVRFFKRFGVLDQSEEVQHQLMVD